MADEKNKQKTGKDQVTFEDAWQERVTGVSQERIGDYLPSPFNPRTHDETQKKHFRSSAQKHGKVGVLVAYMGEDGEKYLFNGHLRQGANLDERWYVAMTDLSEQEAKELLVTYDYLGELAGLDEDIFNSILKEWEETDDDLIDALLDMHGPARVLSALEGVEEVDSILGDLTSAAENWEPTVRPSSNGGGEDEAIPVYEDGGEEDAQSGDGDRNYFDAGALPDAPAARDNERSFMLYVTYASEETFLRGIRALSMDINRNLKVSGQRFARIDGEKLLVLQEELFLVHAAQGPAAVRDMAEMLEDKEEE